MTDTPTVREDAGAWAKLRRGKVVQWGVAYVAGGWALLQGVGFLVDTFHWPDAIKQVATLVLLVGLPIVLVLAWYHGDRGQQRFTTAELVILTLLLAAGSGVLSVYERRSEPAPADTTGGAAMPVTTRSGEDRPSIAVLPFENRSRLEDDAFFVDGIHDDILTQLSKVSAFKVISRTSVEQFRDTRLPTKTIAGQLGVTTILEGGVQRAGDRVRINVQLIDAKTDAHLWAEIYDRELTAANIFAIQSEVAAAIAGALKATLTAGEKARVEAAPTQNLEAWEAYQIGRQRLAKRTSESLADAEQFFRKSIGLDPDFALAYVGVADTLLLRLGYTGFPQAETLERAEAVVTEALAREPNLSEAVAGAAYIALIREDYAAAESGFLRSIELSPSSAKAYQGCSRLYGLMGRNNDSLRYAERAAELDPLSVILNVNLGRALERVGRFGDALARYRKAIEIDPSVPTSHFFVGSVYAHAFGRLNQAVPWFEKAAELDPGNPSYSLMLAGTYVDLGNLVDARRWLDQATKHGAEYQDVATVEALLDLYDGAPARMVRTSRKVLEVNPRNPYALNLLRVDSLRAGQYASIRDLYARAFPELASADPPVVDGSNYGPAVDFACLMQMTGDPDRAARLLDGSERVLHSNQRMGWEGYGMLDVQIHALRGDKVKALAAMREAEMAGWRSFGWRYYRDFDPNLAAIRNEPEFKAVFADIERDMASQRAELAARPKDAPPDLAPVR